MCTIMLIPGVKPENSDKAWQFAKAARPLLTKGNEHSFGYAAIGPEGLFSERWTNVKQALSSVHIPERGMHLLNSLLGTAVQKNGYALHGTKTNEVNALILHARFATQGERTIENAHPFIIDGTALIHNGMIQNHAELTKKISQCDSETILNEYLKHGVATNVSAIQKVADKLDGWYAVAAFTPHTTYGYILDIFRSGANLHAGYVVELDTVVFATKPHLIKQAAKQCGFTCGPIIEVPEELLIRINPYTGELISHTEFSAGMLTALRKPVYHQTNWWQIERNGKPLFEDDDGKLMPIQSDAFTQDDVRELHNRLSQTENTESAIEYMERTTPSKRKRRNRR